MFVNDSPEIFAFKIPESYDIKINGKIISENGELKPFNYYYPIDDDQTFLKYLINNKMNTSMVKMFIQTIRMTKRKIIPARIKPREITFMTGDGRTIFDNEDISVVLDSGNTSLTNISIKFFDAYSIKNTRTHFNRKIAVSGVHDVLPVVTDIVIYKLSFYFRERLMHCYCHVNDKLTNVDVLFGSSSGLNLFDVVNYSIRTENDSPFTSLRLDINNLFATIMNFVFKCHEKLTTLKKKEGTPHVVDYIIDLWKNPNVAKYEEIITRLQIDYIPTHMDIYKENFQSIYHRSPEQHEIPKMPEFTMPLLIPTENISISDYDANMDTFNTAVMKIFIPPKRENGTQGGLLAYLKEYEPNLNDQIYNKETHGDMYGFHHAHAKASDTINLLMLYLSGYSDIQQQPDVSRFAFNAI